MSSGFLGGRTPQKCHFLYLLERPLQQSCTTVQTVMPVGASCNFALASEYYRVSGHHMALFAIPDGQTHDNSILYRAIIMCRLVMRKNTLSIGSLKHSME